MSDSLQAELASPPRLLSESVDADDVQDVWPNASAFHSHPQDTDDDDRIPLGRLDFASAQAKLAKDPTPPAIDASVGPSPIADAVVPHSFDPTADSRSLPAVLVDESPSVAPAESLAQNTQPPSLSQASLDSARAHLRASAAGTSPSPSPSPTPSRRSAPGHRTPPADPVARSPNRLSGFLSNLIHRRDAHGLAPPSPLSATGNDRATTPDGSGNASRASSPAPPPRSATPPPSLPAPSLRELGLSLSVLTSDLSPSHFSTPPASGAFLNPHHLLLCHAHGLDVLPLVSPPAPQPYALIRRVPFKSVVVMEHRGVLVAIAGRRDGVRVYALDEVKRAVEWRLDVEIRRERDRARREEAKRASLALRDSASLEKPHARPPDVASLAPKTINRSASVGSALTSRPARKKSATPPPQQQQQPAPTIQWHPPSPTPPPLPPPPPLLEPLSPPPSYQTAPIPPRQSLRAQPSAISLEPRRGSITDVLGASVSRRGAGTGADGPMIITQNGSEKAEWHDASDEEEEAINALTAGTSGSQALDERTSAMTAALTHPDTAASATATTISASPAISASSNSLATPGGGANQSRRLSTATLTPASTGARGRRPPDLNLDVTSTSPVRPAPPSPTPTLHALRQALLSSPQARFSARSPLINPPDDDPASEDDTDEPVGGGGGEGVGTGGGGGGGGGSGGGGRRRNGSGAGDRTPTNERITFAEALLESRIPELPPPGSVVVQEAILLSDAVVSGDDESAPASPTASARTRQSEETVGSGRRQQRRRWSVMNTIFTSASPSSDPINAAVAGSLATSPSLPASPTADAPPRRAHHHHHHHSNSNSSSHQPSRAVSLSRSQSSMRVPSASRAGTPARPSTASGSAPSTRAASVSALTDAPPIPSAPSASSRFLSRIFGTGRRTDERTEAAPDARNERRSGSVQVNASPAPKLEYVKLPGTKGALLIKAVETNKKSFLAILCGDNGEKVELFAGTYRTALGLSRTFILPDSPRSLELQLQGDDLVEVFLVFAQNVFGLEPATVRVREVRIGRAERRAARRRARELRGADEQTTAEGEGAAMAPVEETTTVTVTVGVDPSAPAIAAAHDAAATAAAQDELLTVAAAQAGPYTTFQQLPFAPNFPLAAIADEYVIPPTYPDFLAYRTQYEASGRDGGGDGDGDGDEGGGDGSDSSGGAGAGVGAGALVPMQFTPPGLPVPPPPTTYDWYYRDPKGRVHGPWETARMEMWYKDGLLPTDLPVRRAEEATYTLLKDLRQQSIDPAHPFRSAPPLHSFASAEQAAAVSLDGARPLLDPISLLTQARIFGPPALFYSTRGGHSTVIVDGRGRSVLKGRFVWSVDEDGVGANGDDPAARLGDVKRLEAFDVADRAVLVAMRQGGFEAVDFADALLRPADASRHVLPQLATTPSQVNRRAPFTWKIGMPVDATSLLPLKGHARTLHAPVRRGGSTPPGGLNSKSPAKSDFGPGAGGGVGSNEGDNEHTRDEVVFLGRKGDAVYLCERNGGAFRILRLGPTVPTV